MQSCREQQESTQHLLTCSVCGGTPDPCAAQALFTHVRTHTVCSRRRSYKALADLVCLPAVFQTPRYLAVTTSLSSYRKKTSASSPRQMNCPVIPRCSLLKASVLHRDGHKVCFFSVLRQGLIAELNVSPSYSAPFSVCG